MRCLWQVEIDPYARQVLQKNWPEIWRWDDVRTFLRGAAWRARKSLWQCDLICGGFPCQPVSVAGRRRGEADERWLWPEFARILRILRPRYALLENVPGLLRLGFGSVLRDLHESGYDAEWTMLPAATFGAPHLRWRVFLVAYANNSRQPALPFHAKPGEGLPKQAGNPGTPANTERQQRQRGREPGKLVCSAGEGEGEASQRQRFRHATGNCSKVAADATSRFAGQLWRRQFEAFCERSRNLYWPDPQPWLCGLDDGLSPTLDGVAHRVDQLRCLGNSVVPQIAQWLGEQILAYEEPFA